MNKKALILAKVIIVLIPIVILGWVLNKQFSPLGKLVIKKDFKKESPFISDFYPRIRVDNIAKDGKEYYQTIRDDAVYFDLELPRWYNQATFVIKFKNFNPLLEINGRQNKDKWIFDEKPLESKIIDKALESKDWSKSEEGEVRLLAKNSQYPSIQSFIDDPPNTDQVATYFYTDLSKSAKLPDYKKSNELLEINKTLRGPHTIYTYIKNEVLDYQFTLQDINRGVGEDEVNINVYQQKTGEIIYTNNIPDDENIESNGQASETQQTSINIPDLDEGIYKIELASSDDLLISNIKTKQNKVIFGGRLFIADSPEYNESISSQTMNTDFYSSGKRLVISTSHPDSLQTLLINNSPIINIDQVTKKFVLRKDELISDGLNLINSPKSDLLIESDGYFSFSLDSFFFPIPSNIHKLDFDTKLEDTDYIIATDYHPPAKEDSWSVATAKFNLTDLYIDDDNKVQFMLGAPGLHENEREVRIAEIKVILEKPPLTWQNIIPRFKNYVKGIINK